MTKILLHSGLGNQLFQWAYGHALSEKSVTIRFLKTTSKTDVPHARINLGNYLDNCPHGQFQTTSSISTAAIFSRGNFQNFATKHLNYLDLRSHPGSAPLDFKNKPNLIYGYFQSMNMIKSVETQIVQELESAIHQRFPAHSGISSSEKYSIIHFRRGDTKSIENAERVGLLDSGYYKTVLELSQNRNFVITDDPVEAEKFFKGKLEVSGIFPNTRFDEFETLSMIRKAKQVFCANSTFSWWGAFLALHNSSEVYVPEPFYKSLDLNQMVNYRYSGFNTLSASFAN